MRRDNKVGRVAARWRVRDWQRPRHVVLFGIIAIISVSCGTTPATNTVEGAAPAASRAEPTVGPQDPAVDDPAPAPTAAEEPVDVAEPEPTPTDDVEDPGVVVADQSVGRIDDPGARVDIRPRPCDFDLLVGTEFEQQPICYSMTVPANWDDPADTNTMVLPVLVFEARGAELPDPVVYLAGGPGQHAVATSAAFFSNFVEPYVDKRDVIMFDQRGVGDAQPSLECPEFDELTFDELESVAEATDLGVLAGRQCGERLSAEYDLSLFGTVSASHDVEAMRAVLGYDQWNLLGVSYGSRLAQTILRLYPDSIRSAVFDGVRPSAANITAEYAQNASVAIERLFEACGAQPDCNESFPNLRGRWFALLDQFDAEPQEVSFVDVVSGEEVTQTLRGFDLLNFTFQAMYSRDRFEALPRMVADSEQGNHAILSALAREFSFNGELLSLGALYAVNCRNEVAFESVEEVEARAPDNPYYRWLTESPGGLGFHEVCDAWDGGAANPVENQRVFSDRPVLLLGGNFDPITPISGFEEVADGLQASWPFVFESEGHAVMINPCAAELARIFFDEPLSPPSDPCFENQSPPLFVGSEPFVLAPFEVDLAPGRLTLDTPDVWTEAPSAGGTATIVRNTRLADPVFMWIGAPLGSLNSAALLPQLSTIGSNFEAQEPVTAGGRTWEYSISREDDGLVVAVFVSPSGAANQRSPWMTFAAPDNEFDTLIETVVIPGLESLQTG